MTSAKHYKCGVCGWVHFELSLKDAQTHTDAVNAAPNAGGKPVTIERYFACSRCGASSATFVPALPGDAPPLSNLCGIVLQSKRERNIELLRKLTKPMTQAEVDRLDLERTREILLRQGRTEAEVAKLLSNGEHKE